MTRRYKVKFDGHEYYQQGSFSFGAYDALAKALEKHSPNFEPISGGTVVGYEQGFEVWRFEAIDHKAQQGLVAWVHSLN